MNRSRGLLLSFAVCMSLILGVMLWLSFTMLRLEVTQAAAERQSESERLALWRMESIVLPILMQEAIRPVNTDGILILPDPDNTPEQQEIDTSNWIMARYQVLKPSEDDVFAPVQRGSRMSRTEQQTKMPQAESVPQSPWSYAELQRLIPEDASAPVAMINENAAADPDTGQNGIEQKLNDILQMEQQQRTLTEYNIRKQTVDNNTLRNNGYYNTLFAGPDISGTPSVVWIDNQLTLLREVKTEGCTAIQTSVMDWDGLRGSLLDQVRNLLPDATLVPEPNDDSIAHPLQLATLPARLIPGKAISKSLPSWTPLRLTIAIAWCGLLIATVAVGTAVWKSIQLGDRRATFVSAVTHELRTPLTTFRLYTEMLESGMIADADKTTSYLETMRLEADRLGHLIENVLSYSRLEKGANPVHCEPFNLHSALQRATASLSELAAQREMTLKVNLPDEALTLNSDQNAIERILFNLVDNAGKYGISREHPEIVIDTGATEKEVWISVRDRGPGLSADARKRLFRPFSRSANEAAGNAPGVGLGLALCRRIARRLGGELTSDDTITDGARFVLTLPGKL